MMVTEKEVCTIKCEKCSGKVDIIISREKESGMDVFYFYLNCQSCKLKFGFKYTNINPAILLLHEWVSNDGCVSDSIKKKSLSLLAG